MHQHAAWLEIDLAALKGNLSYFKDLTGKQVMAVVKANAYGHGVITVSKNLERSGVDWFGVARAEEGLELRLVGIKSPILVLGYTPPAMAAEAIKHGLSLCVYDRGLLNDYHHAAQKVERQAKIHIKVDTGMGRLGIDSTDLVNFLQTAHELSHIKVEGIFSHLSKADEADISYTRGQLQQFESVLGLVHQPDLLIHSANSAGALAHTDSHYDLVRIGIALYGLSPSAKVPAPDALKPILSWKAAVAQIKRVAAGREISYGGIYVTKTDETIATIPVGYGDGFRRVPHHSASVLIQGHRAPVVGRVCMDHVMVNITGLNDVNIGDEAVIIGQQNGISQTADDLAMAWGTINYEVVTGLSARLPRIYLP